MNLEGRKVLLTGGSAGVGRVIARALHARGASLLLSGRDAAALEELCAELGDRAEKAVADLAVREDVRRLAEQASSVDVLVSNAALPGAGKLDGFSPEEIDRALDVNLRAPMQLARALLPGLLERGEGHLVFVSSLLGKMARPGSSVYCATKFGLRGFALSLTDDLQGTGVGVTTVLPGFIRDVGMMADTGVTPPRGMGLSSPDEVAAAVVRGIERGDEEIVVAPRSLKLGAFLMATAPRKMAKMRRRKESYEYAEAMAQAQASKR